MKKKDLSTGLGLLLGVVAVLISMVWGQDNPLVALRLFWDIPSLFITIIGSFMAVIISFPPGIIKRLPAALKNAFIEHEIAAGELIVKFVDLSKKARREGLLSLESELEEIGDDFLKNGIQMVVDGIEPETIKEIMELEIDETESRHEGPIQVFRAWSGLAPAFGMLGTLIGLIQMLACLQDQSKLGPGLSTALITSFYGSVLANLVFTPIANKLQMKSDSESNRRQMMVDGVLSIQSGVNPRIIEEKLKTYLSPDDRFKFSSSQIEGDAVKVNG